MKTTKIIVAGIALMSALSVSAQSGRPANKPTNAGQERKALVHARNEVRKTAPKADKNIEARKHGAETAQANANARAKERANENSALKQDLGSGTTTDPRERAEKRKDGEKRKKEGPRGKSEGKRKDK